MAASSINNLANSLIFAVNCTAKSKLSPPKNYRNYLMGLYLIQLASVCWFCHSLNLANMKSQLIYTFPLPISGFFIVQTRRLHSICSQLAYNILGPLAVGSCWVSFRFVLGSLESSWAWASSWTGAVDEAVDVAVAVVMPFWHLITI